MFDDHNESIKEVVLSAQLLDIVEVEEEWNAHLQTGKSFADTLTDAGLLERDDILKALAAHLHTGYIPTPLVRPEEHLAHLIKPEQAHKYGVVPHNAEPNKLTFVAKDPLNFSIVDDLSFILQRDVELAVSDPDCVQELIIKTYGDQKSTIEDFLHDIETLSLSADADDSEITQQANQTPIIRFVDLVLQEAVKAKASDIHFEPFEDQFRIRYRIDGSLYEMAPPPKSLAPSVIARVKVMSF